MAESIIITEEDRVEAENILEQFLTDKMGDEADFSKGGALRDLTIGALAYIYAYMKKERDYILARQSLLLLGSLTGTDVDDAVDEILSNWFVTRKTGRESTGTATVYLNAQESVTIPTTARFYKTADLQFKINSETDLAYSEDDLMPISDSSGEIVAYSFDVPLISVDKGEEYDISPGAFADFTKFASSIIRVENTSTFSGGSATETTEEMLERSETAVTVRDLNSARSIDAVLKEEFTTVDDVTVIGYGDAEMVRDLVIEEATNTRIHAGGHVDAYLRTPITSDKTFTGTVGSTFTDPRPGYFILRDSSVANFEDVEVGDILEIYNHLPASEPNRYIVKNSTNYGVYVSERTPFPGALPEIEESFDDGAVTTGSAQLESTGHTFATILATHSDGSVVTGVTTFVTAGAYTFTTDDLDRYIRITGSGSGNDGTWEIVSIVDPSTVELRDADGNPPSFTTEGSLTWDLMTSTDVGKYVRISNSTLGNDGVWRIVAIVDADHVELRDALYASPTFTTESGLDWELLTRVVEYSIGKNPPHYNDRVTRRLSGEFTRIIQNDGRILLPAEPIYRITDVSFASTTSPYEVDNRVTFPNRVNVEPEYILPANPEDLSFQVIGYNPGEIPSGWQVLELDIGWPDGAGTYEQKNYFNDQSLRVTYDALTGYDAIWTYMISGDQRILCGSVIPKGLHPVYLHMNINYRTAKTATEGLDTDEAAAGLAAFINDFDTREDMDTSDMVAYLRENFDVIGYIQPMVIYYDLLSPDGRVIYYKTEDQVVIDSDRIIDPDTDLPPTTAQTELRLDEPIALGVSDNTVRYLTVAELITFTELE
jgi:hypothetical protein